MQWLNKVVDQLVKDKPTGEIIVSSGVTPSGTYHVGTLREVLTADAILLELRRRGRQCRHIHLVDDLDVFRKVPINVPPDYEKHLGRPLYDIPAPEGQGSYADYFFNDFLTAAGALELDMEVKRSHQVYQSGFMVEAIESALANLDKIRQILETVSGHKLGDEWSPVQVVEDGYLKNRQFVSIDTSAQTIRYLDNEGQQRQASYAKGEVKLNWRVDWPARWWLMAVDAEPFGRDHATKGGSYDTGAAIIKQVFKAEPPLPVPYHFINRSGETKKMSKSTGNIIASSDLVHVLPPEIVRYFVLRLPPERQLFFDEIGVTKLIDDFAALLAKPGKTAGDQQLIDICTAGIEPTVSRVPFSHLVASYQAALKDPAKTLEIIGRTEHSENIDEPLVKAELDYIDRWLAKWAPEEIKFELLEKLDKSSLTAGDRRYLKALAEKVSQAPDGADGEWFHKAVYDLSQAQGIEPKQAFQAIYKATIGKTSGPRAGWFLSILPKDWLVNRFSLES